MERKQLAPGVHLSYDPAEKLNRCRISIHFTFPIRRQNATAHALLERFGDFAGVLQASEEELCLVEGVGPAAARFLHLLPQVSACYHRSLTKDRRRMQTVEQMGQYLMARFKGAVQERVLLVCLDRQRRITCTAWLSSGDADSVQLPVKEAIAQAVRLKARWVVLCHNHPSGNAAASRNDITATRQVEMALESIEATLNDHIIFAGEDTLSFAQCGWLGQIKEEVRDYRREELQAAREQEAAILWGDSLL